MKLVSFILITLIKTNLCLSQNLILNPGFEESSECIHNFGEIEVASGWFQQGGSTDYFNVCCKKKNFVGIPQNIAGYQQPLDGGRAYAGFYLFYFDKQYLSQGFYNREYLQTQLRSSLDHNRKYLISFYYNLADSSVFHTDHFSICFTQQKELKKSKVPESLLVGENRISKKIRESDARDTVNWHKVEFEYQAKGGESYLAIGFFHNDLSRRAFRKALKKNKLRHTATQENTCYYYIDNVSVLPFDRKNEFSHQN